MISAFLLLPLYAIFIQHERGGLWRVFYVVGAVGIVFDVVANYTELTILTLDVPRWGEWTFSRRLKRLQSVDGFRGEQARYLAKCLDAIAPSGKHIK